MLSFFRAPRRISLALAAVCVAAACCFAPGAYDPVETEVVSTRDVALGAGRSLRVYGVLTRQHVEPGRSGFGCFGAPYPSFRWETGRPSEDIWDDALAVAPGVPAATVDAARLSPVTTSPAGSVSDRATALAHLARRDVIACADSTGRYAVAWGVLDGSGQPGVTLVGLEAGSTLLCAVDPWSLDVDVDAAVPDDLSEHPAAEECAWLAEHHDVLAMGCPPG